MKDYYKILGVDRNASAAEIKQAYRKLAMRHHPDRGGDSAQFQEIQAAYEAVSNPSQQPDTTTRTRSSAFDFDTIFEMFGADLRAQQRQAVPKISIWISFEDAFAGAKKAVNLQLKSASSNIELDVPAGVNDGDNVRYRGLAPNGADLIVQFRVKPHPVWRRIDNDLSCTTTVDIWKLILGTEILVADPAGNQYNVVVPPETQPGAVMRLRGKGMPAVPTGIQHAESVTGDLLIELQACIPTPIDPELRDVILRKTRP